MAAFVLLISMNDFYLCVYFAVKIFICNDTIVFFCCCFFKYVYIICINSFLGTSVLQLNEKEICCLGSYLK